MNDRPPIRVLIGPAGSGKTTRLLDLYRREIVDFTGSHDPAGRWIAPSRIAAEEVRAQLAAGGRALLEPGVGTFADLALELLHRSGRHDRPISPIQRRRLLARVIADLAAEGGLAYFGPAAKTPGLVTFADRWIADLKRQGGVTNEFRRIAERRGAREQDLARIYGGYERRLAAARCYDAEGLLTTALEAIGTSRALVSPTCIVVADGFTKFTAAERRLLRLLATSASETWVSLVGEGEDVGDDQDQNARLVGSRDELFGSTREMLARLRDELDVEAFHEPASRHAWPAAGRMAAHLFRPARNLPALNAEEARSADRLTVIAASSRQGECEELARQVKRRLLAGAAPEDVVVAFRSTEKLADRLRAVFADYGIPYWIDARQPLAGTAPVRRLLNALRLAADDWPYRMLLRIVGDAGFAILDRAADEEPCYGKAGRTGVTSRAAIERTIREAQLPAGREALFEQLAAWRTLASRDRALSNDETSLQAAAATAHEALSRLAQRLNQLPEATSLADWIDAVELLAGDLFLAPPRSAADDRDSIALRAWIASLKTLVRLDQWARHDDPLSLVEFIEVASEVAVERTMPDEYDAVGRVRLVRAETACFLRPRHLLIGDLNEQAFPRLGSDDGDRFTGGEGENAPAAELVGNASNDETILFYRLVCRATESLTLSYTALDAKAQAVPPSPFVAETLRLFEGAPVQRATQPLGLAAQQPETPLSQTELRLAGINQASEGRRELLAALAQSAELAHVGRSILAGVEGVASRRHCEQFGPFEGMTDAADLHAKLASRFGPHHHWSASQLETYATCPFQFFGKHVLRLRPAPELALRGDVQRRGMLLHDTLSRLYAEHSDELFGQAEDALDPAAAGALITRFRDVLQARAAAHPGRGLDRALREIERRQIDAWARRFAEQHEAYRRHAAWQALEEPLAPRHFEARFGPGSRRSETVEDARLSTDEPYELKLPSETIKLTGQIDRIDVGRVGGARVFNVIDYKSGKDQVASAEKIAAGLQLQLALYAMAAAELLLADQQATPLTAGYWSVAGQGYVRKRAGAKGPLVMHELAEGTLREAEGWKTLRRQVLARVEEIIRGVRGGWFPVASSDPACTRWCEYSKICRVAQVRSLDKTWMPPGLPANTPTKGSA